MIDKKKIIAFALSVVAICSFVGCSNKEETKTEKNNDEIVSQETENNSIVGTWIVEKTEIYDGPLKQWMKETFDKYYPVGSEWEFTADNKIKSCSDESLTTNYRLISDTEIEIIAINNGEVNKQEYELNGDTLIQYGLYNGDFSKYGRANAIYYKRK